MINGDAIDSSAYIFVHHTHFDHAADVPYIAMKTGARVIGTESLANLLKAHGVPEKQIITVQGGEDYDFEDFSVKYYPPYTRLLGINNILAQKRFQAISKFPFKSRNMLKVAP